MPMIFLEVFGTEQHVIENLSNVLECVFRGHVRWGKTHCDKALRKRTLGHNRIFDDSTASTQCIVDFVKVPGIIHIYYIVTSASF